MAPSLSPRFVEDPEFLAIFETTTRSKTQHAPRCAFDGELQMNFGLHIWIPDHFYITASPWEQNFSKFW